MRVEVFYVKDCPHHAAAVEQVRRIAAARGKVVEVEEVEVCDAATGRAMGFLGSPTVRVDGLDVEEEARGVEGFGLGCRTYVDGGVRSGLPAAAWIERALSRGPAE